MFRAKVRALNASSSKFTSVIILINTLHFTLQMHCSRPRLAAITGSTQHLFLSLSYTMAFSDIPPDILELIAFFVAINPLLGPPSELLSFISLSKFTYDSLSLRKNPSLYARICAVKFDLDAPLRRLGKAAMLPQALANELVKRCIVLKRFKATSMAHIINPMPEEEETLNEMLWTAFFMVLENDGRNVIQLRNSGVAGWLNAYWFDTAGSSHAMSLLQDDEWPALGLGSPRNSISPYRCSQHLTLAMWLLWFFFEPGKQPLAS